MAGGLVRRRDRDPEEMLGEDRGREWSNMATSQ